MSRARGDRKAIQTRAVFFGENPEVIIKKVRGNDVYHIHRGSLFVYVGDIKDFMKLKVDDR